MSNICEKNIIYCINGEAKWTNEHSQPASTGTKTAQTTTALSIKSIFDYRSCVFFFRFLGCCTYFCSIAWNIVIGNWFFLIDWQMRKKHALTCIHARHYINKLMNACRFFVHLFELMATQLFFNIDFKKFIYAYHNTSQIWHLNIMCSHFLNSVERY